MISSGASSRNPRWLGLLAVAVIAATLGLDASSGGANGAENVAYDDKLSTSWSNWSWGSVVDFARPAPYRGTHSIGWRVDQPWAGLYLHSYQKLPTGSGTSLRFALRMSDPSQQLSLWVYGDDLRPLTAAKRLPLGDSAGGWKAYDVNLNDMGVNARSMTGFVLQDTNGHRGDPLVEVDEVVVSGVPMPAGQVEIRPENTVANYTRGRPTKPELFDVDPSFRPYYDRINGDFVGTTEQILAWAARKWGFDQLGYPDLGKAMAVIESWWKQSAVNSSSGAHGILQVHPAYWPDPEPARWSTAYNADYAMAVVRYLYDPGSWLGNGTTGNIRNAVAAWQCGCGYNGLGSYATQVFTYDQTKPWLRPGQPPEWF